MRQSTDLECRLVLVAGVLATLRRVLWTDTADAYARRREGAVGRDDGESGDEERVGERDGDGDGSEEEDDDDDNEHYDDGEGHESEGDEDEDTGDDESNQGDDINLDHENQDIQILAESVEKSDSRVVEGSAEVSGPGTPAGEETDDIFLQNLDPALRPT